MSFRNLKAVIPVREGSERVKEKVLLPFANVTLYEWKILQLLQVLPPEQIVVSTNSERLIDIALKYNLSIHKREDKYCIGNEIPFSEVIHHVISGIDAEHIAWTTCVVPLMSPKEYKDGFIQYYKALKDGHDSLVAFNLLKDYLWNDEGSLNYSASEGHVVSQKLPNVYRVTNGLYMAPKEIMLKRKYFVGCNPYKFIVSKIAGIDIDYLEDYKMSLSLINMYYEEHMNEVHDNLVKRHSINKEAETSNI
ncbi:MAG: cytidylyltransferase domain-containing protein [Eubacteriales bacterium]